MEHIMSKSAVSAVTLAAAMVLASTAFAQAPPEGGQGAKANAPVKSAHTVNDGAAKPGHNSFTEAQARQHVINAGYSSVSNVAMDMIGVWQGLALKGANQVNVALDYKGNVSEGGPAAPNK